MSQLKNPSGHWCDEPYPALWRSIWARRIEQTVPVGRYLRSEA